MALLISALLFLATLPNAFGEDDHDHDEHGKWEWAGVFQLAQGDYTLTFARFLFNFWMPTALKIVKLWPNNFGRVPPPRKLATRALFSRVRRPATRWTWIQRLI
mmetsp:Transcript_9872/g.18961  ORF Transcript_9872/g.18961 Transcript_9872/m.18961 type:complete len:104 (+) Transcript_9872:2002-2313(+)